MNISGRNLLSLTVYHLKNLVKKVLGQPGNIWVIINGDGTATVGGNGAKPGDTLTVTFPDGTQASTIVKPDGSWEVRSETQQPGLEVKDVVVTTEPPNYRPVIDSITVTQDGKYLVAGHGGRAGDTISFTIDEVTYTLNLDGSDVWFFTVTPEKPPKDLDPGDVDVGSDYVPPFVISIVDNKNGTFTVNGGGGKIGDTLNVQAGGVIYTVVVSGANGWTALVGKLVEDEIVIDDPYIPPYVVSITDNGNSTYTIVGAGGNAGDTLSITVDGKSVSIVTNADDNWTVTLDMTVPEVPDVGIGSDYVPPYVTSIVDNGDGTYTVHGAGGKIGDNLTVTINDQDYLVGVTTPNSWSAIVDTTAPEDEIDVGSDYVTPYVISVTDNGNSTYTVIGAGGDAGDTLTVTIDGKSYTIVTTADDSWSVIVQMQVPEVPDVGVGSDYVPPYVITVTDNGVTFIVLGGGGRVGDTLQMSYQEQSYTVTVNVSKSWTVEVTKFVPDVVVDDTYVPPRVISVTNNGDGTYTIIGVGGLAGDELHIKIGDKTFTAIIETSNSWQVTIEFQISIDLGDIVVVVVKPSLEGYVNAADAIYADIDGLEFVEVDDEGNYIAWEQFVVEVKKYIGIAATPEDSGYLKYYSGYPKDIVHRNGTYISQYDNVYKIYSGSIDSAIEVTAAKNYMTPKAFGLFSTANSAYYLKAVGSTNVLTRYDGAETSIVFNYVDNQLAVMTDVGGKDWFCSNTASYLIDPSTLAVTIAPLPQSVVLLASCAAGSAGEYILVESGSKTDSSTMILVLNKNLAEVARIPNGRFICGDKYFFVKSGQGGLRRYDAKTLEVTEMESNVSVSTEASSRYGFTVGDFAIFYGAQNDKTMVTYDAGVTWSAVSLGNPYIAGMDFDSGELIVGAQYGQANGRPYNFARFKMIEA
jgi:RecB family endonuclease NucS